MERLVLQLFVGRKKELDILEKEYESKDNSLVILYGRDGIGKTRLAKEFAVNKKHKYYLGREYAKDEQNRYFLPALDEIRKLIKIQQNEKVCFIIDEFEQIYKGNRELFTMLKNFMDEPEIGANVMLLLLSSSVQWVEQEMVKAMGEMAVRITSFFKLKEFTFLEMVHFFPNSSTEDCIIISGLLGGVPKYLEYWDAKLSMKENIQNLFICGNGRMKTEASRFLRSSLRELSVYNTILSILAEDENKLNYLYNRTGFSRAKISVYINNLIQLDVAGKIFSFEPDKRDRIKKGLYGITDAFLHFWYKFMYPNLSQLEWEDANVFFAKYIEPGLDDYICYSFINVCKEYLTLMNHYKRLPFTCHTMGSLYGKNGFIPIVIKGEKGELLIGMCKWGQGPMNSDDFDKLLTATSQVGGEVDYYYLFARQGFSDELTALTKGLENVTLVDLNSL